MRKIFKSLIIVAFIIACVPAIVNADDTRIVVSNVELTSNMEVPTYGGEVKSYYTYETVAGEPAYMTPHMGAWYRKDGPNWYKYNDAVFREGTYYWTNQIRIDDSYGTTHRLAENTTLTVDGVAWTMSSSISIYNSYSMGYYNSPEYVVEKVNGYELTFRDSDNYNIGENYANNAIESFSVANGVIGGTEPYVFSKVFGPNWINVSSDGTISGTPVEAGANQNLVVRVTDAEDNYKEITITIGTTNVDPADRTTISNVVITSNMTEPEYGEEVKTYYTYETVTGAPAYMTPHMGAWYRKVNNNWVRYNESTFIEGTYTYYNQIRIDDASGLTHKLAEDTILTVDGHQWTLDDGNSVSIYNTYSMGYYRSEEFVVDEHYTVEFNTNGGNNIDSQVIEISSKAVKPENPTKAGYVFIGWYEDSELTEKFDFNTPIIDDMVLYAKWSNNLSDAVLRNIANKTYTGTAQRQNEIVELGDIRLVRGTDYTVKYTNNVNAGTATITVTGKGSYTGSKSRTFKILRVSLENATLRGIANKTYTGKAQTQNEIVELNGVRLVRGTDYTVTYSNNVNAGTATITVTGKGNYTGSKSRTFKIVIQPVTITKVSSTKKGVATVTYAKSEGVTGYQIAYRERGTSTWKYVRTTALTRNITGLNTNKYEIKVRTFATIDGSNYYSTWSASKVLSVK